MVQSKSTQDFMPIKEIRDGVMIIKDGSYRMVMMASSLNFALKSEDEQEAIIYQFQNFLNSLDFPVQIFIESRKLNIEPYLATLQEAEKKQASELLKIQIKEYMEFVKGFVSSNDIVSKMFYIVVSYQSSADILKKSFFSDFVSGLKGPKDKKEIANIANEDFGKCKIQLQQRVDVVIQGLVRCGVRVVPLNTEELIELFYKLFNPGEAGKEIVNVPLGK